MKREKILEIIKLTIALFTLVFLRILTELPCAESVNYLLLKISERFFSGIFLNYELNELYGNQVHLHVLGITVAALGALFIPPFISIYENSVKKNRSLVVDIIKNKYSPLFIVRIIFYFLFIGFSTSTVYWAIVSMLIALEVFLIYKDYYDIVFSSNEKVLERIGALLAESSKVNSSFRKTSEEVQIIIGRHRKKSDGVGKVENSKGYYYFATNNNVIGVFPSRLERFLSNLHTQIKNHAKVIDSSLIGSDLTPNEGMQGYLYSIKEYYTSDNRGIQLFITFSETVDEENLKPELTNIKDAFSNCFKFLEDKKTIRDSLQNYFDEFYHQIIDLIENKRGRDFVEELKLVRRMVELNTSSELLDNISIILRSILKLQNRKDRLLSDEQRAEIYELWEDIFRALRNSDKTKDITFATYILINGLKQGYWPEDIVGDLDRNLTSFFSYSDASVSFYDAYLSELSQQVARNESENVSSRLINFISFIRDDFSEGVRDDEVEENSVKSEVWQLAEEKIMLLAAYSIYKNKNYKERCFNLIDKNRFLITLYSLYSEKRSELGIIWWNEHDFDRKGLGQVQSFNSFDFFKSFVISFIEEEGNECLKGQELDYRMLHLFHEISKERSGDEVLKELIQNAERFKEDLIIKENLNEKQLREFVDACKESYLKTSKISEYLKKTFKENNTDNTFGYNITMPREYFTTVTSSILTGLGEYGRGMARGENTFVVKKIKEIVNCEHCNHESFFKEVLCSYIEDGSYLLVTNLDFWRREFFEWNGPCKLNKELVKHDRTQDSTIEHIPSGKKIKYVSVSVDNSIDEKFALFVKADGDVELNFSKAFDKNADNIYDIDERCWIKFEDLANMPETIEEIISGKYFDKMENLTKVEKTRFLKLKVGMKMYINPSVKIDCPAKYYILTGL